MSDEGFHEIQLNGKQLVFLFMAATVVSVVIFLCGVMVGRGVQTARAGTAEGVQPAASEVRAVEPARGEAAATGAPPAEEPAPIVEEDYYDRLVEGTRRESLSTAGADRATDAPRRSQPPPASRPATTNDKPAARSAPAETPPPKPKASETSAPSPVAGGSSSGFAVQLAALRERSEADAIAKRLVAKGYQAYVLLPSAGSPPVYRVQVGRFDTRREADRVAARLKKEERFDPWVTR